MLANNPVSGTNGRLDNPAEFDVVEPDYSSTR
jgi:hypothetical protein